MLNRKSIERALAKYVAHKDPEVLERLTAFGPMLLKAADIAKQLKGDVTELSEDDLTQVREGHLTLLSKYPVTIPADSFVGVAQELGHTLFEALQLEGDIADMCATVNWADFATDSLLKIAGQNPIEYFEEASKVAEDSDFFDFFILPVLSYSVRVFLDAYATEWSRELANEPDDTPRNNRPLHCPVCGLEGTIASVSETTANGNRKKLHCTCCGSQWLFERIRCAHCGNSAVSDFDYIHDEEDDIHRLHVCKACGEAMPTVFSGEELNFNADVEQIVMTGLELFYEASLEEEKAKTQAQN